jgi:hypothetical protein
MASLGARTDVAVLFEEDLDGGTEDAFDLRGLVVKAVGVRGGEDEDAVDVLRGEAALPGGQLAVRDGVAEVILGVHLLTRGEDVLSWWGAGRIEGSSGGRAIEGSADLIGLEEFGEAGVAEGDVEAGDGEPGVLAVLAVLLALGDPVGVVFDVL